MKLVGQKPLDFGVSRSILLTDKATVAQLVEQLIRNRVVTNQDTTVAPQQVSFSFYLPFHGSQAAPVYKQCRICGVWRPLSDYYKDTKRRGGYYRDCKSCHRARVAEWRRNNVQRHRDNVRRWSREHRDVRHEYGRKYEVDHPDRKRAHRIVQQAVRSGKLHRGPCAYCGAIENIHGHHEDYSKPLEVVWLCRTCHLKRHNQFAAYTLIDFLNHEAAA